MSEATPPQDQSEPITGPVLTPLEQQVPPPLPPQPQPVYVEQSHRLNKVAAWVGIVAGSLFIVVVIFGAGFFTGKAVSDGHRGDYESRGHEMMFRPGGMPMMPMMPPGQMQRGPGNAGPFGPGGPMIVIPREPGNGPGTPGTSAPPRP